MSRQALAVDPLRSWARRRGDVVEVHLALLGEPRVSGPDVEVRLRARRRSRNVPGTLRPDGTVSFAVASQGLARQPWELAIGPAADHDGSARTEPSGPPETRQALGARVLAAPGRPVALLTGPAQRGGLPPPAPRRRDTAPGGAARRTPRRAAPRTVRRLAGRARAIVARARRQAPAAGSARGGPAVDRPRPASTTAAIAAPAPTAPTAPTAAPAAPAATGAAAASAAAPGRAGRPGAPRAHLDRSGTLSRPLRLLDRSGWQEVLVVGADQNDEAVATWATRLAPARVSRWTADTGDASALVEHLKRLPALDAVVCVLPDLLPAGADGEEVVTTAEDVLTASFPYLRAGGAFLHDRGRRDRSGAEADDRLPAWLATVASAPARGSRREPQGRAAEVRESMGALVVADDLVTVTSRDEHYYLLREHEVPDLLQQREPQVEAAVVASLPAGSVAVAAPEQPHGDRRGEAFPAALPHPELTLRRYRGPVNAGGGMLLFAERTVLPESFRWPTAPQLENSRCLVSGEVARIKSRWVPEETLPGPVFHLDCAYSGHFGHYATETISRLWAWDEAKRQEPGLRAFVHVRPDDPGEGRLERSFLRAYGIRDEDIVTPDRPVRLEDVFGASPMWQNSPPFHAHPDLRAVWERLSAGMLADVAPSEIGRHERIFVSRSAEYSHRRGCRNAAEVEALFAERGFHVFCPEDLTLPEQAALFAGARVVAGYGGSAMANLLHCRRLEALISLSHHGYTARGEHLSMALLGGDFHYFWAESDVTPPARGRTLASFRSGWELDLERYGDELRAVLAAY